MEPEQGVGWHSLLRCGLLRVELGQRTVVFFVPEGHCTDMEGAIQLAKQINPDVRFIATVSGGQLDTCYQRFHVEWSVVRRMR